MIDIVILKRYNDEAESCLDRFDELKYKDPVLAEKYNIEAGKWIKKGKDLIIRNKK